MDPIPLESPIPPSADATPLSSVWVWLSVAVGWLVGSLVFLFGVQTGLLPTAHQMGSGEFISGAIIFGFLVGLAAGQVAQALVRRRRFPFVLLVGTVFGMVAGALIGYVVVREFLGALWVGFGGFFVGGLVADNVGSRRTKRST